MTIARLTLEEHLELAEKIRRIKQEMFEVCRKCTSSFPNNSKVVISLHRALTSYGTFKSRLDDEYHKIATDEDFAKHGHIYYEKK